MYAAAATSRRNNRNAFLLLSAMGCHCVSPGRKHNWRNGGIQCLRLDANFVENTSRWGRSRRVQLICSVITRSPPYYSTHNIKKCIPFFLQEEKRAINKELRDVVIIACTWGKKLKRSRPRRHRPGIFLFLLLSFIVLPRD